MAVADDGLGSLGEYRAEGEGETSSTGNFEC